VRSDAGRLNAYRIFIMTTANAAFTIFFLYLIASIIIHPLLCIHHYLFALYLFVKSSVKAIGIKHFQEIDERGKSAIVRSVVQGYDTDV
jgi:hypothetical protein